uniref:Uncharacterized protein n=1 Tax=Schlesneria paludicola TaxID=360056 RepID=A0A7C2P063_9PLAN
MSRILREPSCTLHRPSGQARVRIASTDHDLWAFGSPESRDAYVELIADGLIRQDASRDSFLIDDLAPRLSCRTM